MKTPYQQYKENSPHKTDEQIIDSVVYELRSKIETIHSLLKENKELNDKLSQLHPEQSEQKKEVVDWDEEKMIGDLTLLMPNNVIKDSITAVRLSRSIIHYFKQHYAISSPRTVSDAVKLERAEIVIENIASANTEVLDALDLTQMAQAYLDLSSPKEEKEVAEITLSDKLFKLANELAIAGHGDDAVALHRISNKLANF